MSLKSVSKTTSTGQANSSSFISRQSGGLCFDFHPKDSNIYIVGTEDGLIHRCSSSYNEQYLDSYNGHTRPVYKVRWSPFLNGVFLSCAADWTVRLWDQDEENDIFKFQNGKVGYLLCINLTKWLIHF
jgi:WD40 repeat protein